MADAAANRSQTIDVSEREWHPMTPTIKTKTIWSDPATKRRVQLTRFEQGATLPMHRHAGDELLYVIEGAISDDAGTVAAGSVGYRPVGCIHSVTSKNGATVYTVITGGVEPAKEVVDAPRSRIIVLSGIPWTEALPGVRSKLFWSDPATNRRAIFARFDPGAKLPRHKHIGDELLFMIERFEFRRIGRVAHRERELLSKWLHTYRGQQKRPHRDSVRHRRLGARVN